MRIIYFLLLLVLTACGSASNEKPEESSSVHPSEDSITRSGMKKDTLSKLPGLRWSQYLGHFFKYIPYDTSKYKISDVSKVYYDIRYGDSSLVVMKCQDFNNCGEKFSVVFNKFSGDTVIFQHLKGDTLPLRFMFYKYSIFVQELNESTLKPETVRYDNDWPNGR
ncbi:MAG: hypothetical protein OEY34_10835 [Cyclobacteriaceae bacterium]|nr:hypothetical protein [Cyclobacteriaceae bacterium]